MTAAGYLLGLLLVLPCVLCVTTAPSVGVKQLASSNNMFTMELYEEISERAGQSNMFFSPTSISMALAMTYAGARGQTKTQMGEVMGFDEAADSDEDFYQACQELIHSLNDPDKNYTLSIANRLFGRQDFDFLQDFLMVTKTYFNASLEELDFGGDSEGSRVYINDWVADQTNQKIKDLIPEGAINAMTALVLVNAIYFKGLWKMPFDAEDTESAPFFTITGGNVDVDMMYKEGYFHYGDIASLDSKIIELPYEGDEVAMGVILPNDRNGLEALEDKLEDLDLIDLMSGISSKKVRVKLPKFKLTQDVSLKAILGSMGMEHLFSPTDANLSGMNGKRDLYVTEVVHKAFVDVNEEGTEAAGATGVIVGVTAVLEVPEFFADHPFIFFIYEKASGSILFMGRLTQPSEEARAVGAFGRSSRDEVDAATSMVPFLSAYILIMVWTAFKTML